MSEHFRFQDVVVALSAKLWESSKNLRGYTYHNTGRCPTHRDPLTTPSLDGPICADCSEFHQQHVMVAHRRINSQAEKNRGGRPIDLRGVTTSTMKNWAFDARDQIDSLNDRAVKVTRLPDSKWFMEACDCDGFNMELITAVVFFARSNDLVSDGDVFPVGTWAKRFGVSEHDVRARIAACITRMSERKADWVVRNIDAPMSQRFAAARATDASEFFDLTDLWEPATEHDEDHDLSEWQEELDLDLAEVS